MADFDLEILTQRGMERVSDIVSVRLVDSFSSTSASGSRTAPSFWRPGQDTFLVVARNGRYPPRVSISGSTVSWSNYQNEPSDFTLYFFSVNSDEVDVGWGFVAYNSDDKVVIDSQFAVLSVDSSGSSTSHADYTTTSWPHNIPCDVDQIVMVDVPVGDYVAIGEYKNGGREVYCSRQNLDYMVVNPGVGEPFVNDTYGLVIYDSNGNRIFDSRVRMLVIADSIAKTPNQSVVIEGLSSDATYVTCFGPRWIWADSQAGGGGQEAYTGNAFYYGMERVSTSRLQLRGVAIAEILSVAPIYGPIPNDSIITAIVGRGYTP